MKERIKFLDKEQKDYITIMDAAEFDQHIDDRNKHLLPGDREALEKVVTFNQRITDNTVAIDTEKQAREQKDTELQSAIDTEKQAREQKDTELQKSINEEMQERSKLAALIYGRCIGVFDSENILVPSDLKNFDFGIIAKNNHIIALRVYSYGSWYTHKIDAALSTEMSEHIANKDIHVTKQWKDEKDFLDRQHTIASDNYTKFQNEMSLKWQNLIHGDCHGIFDVDQSSIYKNFAYSTLKVNDFVFLTNNYGEIVQVSIFTPNNPNDADANWRAWPIKQSKASLKPVALKDNNFTFEISQNIIIVQIEGANIVFKNQQEKKLASVTLPTEYQTMQLLSPTGYYALPPINGGIPKLSIRKEGTQISLYLTTTISNVSYTWGNHSGRYVFMTGGI